MPHDRTRRRPTLGERRRAELAAAERAEFVARVFGPTNAAIAEAAARAGIAEQLIDQPFRTWTAPYPDSDPPLGLPTVVAAASVAALAGAVIVWRYAR